MQQDDRGARSVADGEWRAAMSANSSRVFQWPERSRCRAQWGSERPESPPCASASSVADSVKPSAAGPQLGNERLFDIGEKGLAVHRAVEDHRRGDPVVAKPAVHAVASSTSNQASRAAFTALSAAAPSRVIATPPSCHRRRPSPLPHKNVALGGRWIRCNVNGRPSLSPSAVLSRQLALDALTQSLRRRSHDDPPAPHASKVNG